MESLCAKSRREYNQRMAKFFNRLSQALQKNKPDAADFSPARDAAIGPGATIVQRFRLDAEIGRGGMGIVYRARDLTANRDVAVKIVNSETANALSLQQFAREAEITSRLRHPHIVAVHESGTAETGAPFIVMELAQGTSLSDMHGLTYASVIDIAKQICAALEYAHNQGLVYRDLKPGNVILEKRGFRSFVKLLDFGLARPRGEAYLSTESTRAGTVFYLAPEIIAGQPADIASDLYALGATMYEMITGRLPFSNFDEQAILEQHLNESVAPPSHSRGDVPPALETIVLRLMEKNPADRFASAQEVRQALEQISLASESVAHGNLPPTNVTGRDEEAAQVGRLLESNPLVTLLDEDDSLALAVAAQLAGQFADGAWLVKFESVTEPMLVPQTVASALGVEADPDRPLIILLMQFLREKNLLLILSHCDHLLGACAQLAETILRACPDVRILATSAQPLNLPGETCHRG